MLDKPIFHSEKNGKKQTNATVFNGKQITFQKKGKSAIFSFK
jgi:hypothetical protein